MIKLTITVTKFPITQTKTPEMNNSVHLLGTQLYLLSLCGGLFWMEGDGNFSLPCLLPLDTDSSTCKNKNARRELFPAKDVLTRFWLFWANFSPKKRCIYLSCYHYHYHKEKLSLEGIHIILAVSSLIHTDVLFSPLPNQA